MLPVIAYAVLFIGHMAGAMAAIINGIVLPIFLTKEPIANASSNGWGVVLTYNNAINESFDYLFVSAVCISTLLWSVTLVQKKGIEKFAGILGLCLSIPTIVLFITGFAFLSLHGFRIFLAGNTIWTITVAILLFKSNVSLPDGKQR